MSKDLGHHNNNSVVDFNDQRGNRDTFEPSEEIKAKKFFTIVDQKFIQNRNISLEARMVVIYLTSLPLDWAVNLNHLQKELCVGRDRLAKAMKELKEAGYMQRTPIKCPQGRIRRWHTRYSDRPEFLGSTHITGNQLSGESSTLLKIHNVDFPVPGKQPLQNKQDTNKTILQKNNNKSMVAKKSNVEPNGSVVVSLLKKLEGLSISKKLLTSWVAKHGSDYVAEKIALMQSSNARNPEGYLNQAMVYDWKPRTPCIEKSQAQSSDPVYPTHEQNAEWWSGLPAKEKSTFLKAAMYKQPLLEEHLKLQNISVLDTDFSLSAWFKAFLGLIGRAP
jgi:hypothetical protein